MSFVQARLEHNSEMETFLAWRFGSDMKPAMESWLKLDPLNNPAAPPFPFQMTEYVQAQMAGLAVLLFPGALAALVTIPICHE